MICSLIGEAGPSRAGAFGSRLCPRCVQRSVAQSENLSSTYQTSHDLANACAPHAMCWPGLRPGDTPTLGKAAQNLQASALCQGGAGVGATGASHPALGTQGDFKSGKGEPRDTPLHSFRRYSWSTYSVQET